MRALLPQDLASQCRVANVRDRSLTVHIDNAAWATRLRFLIPELIESLGRLADFATVNEIRLKVVPAATDATSPPEGAWTTRPPDRTSLLELANHVDHADLRDVILRLAAQADAAPTVRGR